MHSHRVIGGDISCRSILIDGDLNVVLADFGYLSMLSNYGIRPSSANCDS